MIGFLSCILFLYTAGRFLTVLLSLVAHADEPWYRTFGFCLISAVVLTGPGLCFWSKLKPKTDNPFLFLVFVLSTSLGTTMLLLWVLYFLGFYTEGVVFVLLVLLGLSGVYGVCSMFKERLPLSSCFRITLPECVALAISLLFCEGIFECSAGAQMSAWDSVVSWDKWAADIASRTGLRGYICGAYPQGIPLICSLFYKMQLPSGSNPVLSVEHLFINGLFQFFPFLLFMSLIASAREYKLNSIFTLGITLGCSGLIHAIIKQSGYADIPLTAAVAALPVLFSLLQKHRGSPNLYLMTAITVLFPVVFIKGNGFAVCLLWYLSLLIVRDAEYRCLRHALFATLVASGVFYLHQWTVGVWTDLGETSPFNHSLAVVSSHRDLVDVSFSHLFRTLSCWADFYGCKSHVLKLCWQCLAVILVFLPLFFKKTFFPGLGMIAVIGIWFFTGSYDARNLFFILPVLSVIIPLSLNSVCGPRPVLKKSIVAIAVVFCLYSVFQTRALEIASRTFHPYKAPKEISFSDFDRQKKFLKMYGDEVLFFTESDVAKRASHIISASTAYRHLSNKGVYPLQKNGSNDVKKHDVAFSMSGGQKKIFSHPAFCTSFFNAKRLFTRADDLSCRSGCPNCRV